MTLNLDGSTADVEKLAAYIGVIAWSTLLDALAGHSSGLGDLAPDDWRQELLRHTDEASAAVQAAALPSFRKIARSADQQVKATPLDQQKLVEPWLQKMSQAGAFTDPKSLEESKKVNKIVLAARTKTQEYVGYAMSGLKGQAAETFTQITSDAALAIKNGKTPQEGLAQASRAWAKTGVPTLKDKAGRHWQPETYLRMVVQNQVKQTTNDVMIQRTKETSGLVKVSSHAACRPTHLQYQGQVYSVNGDITDYPDLYEATNFGSAGGLSGINCHHYVMTYVPGFDTPDYDTADPDSNNAAYALTQQQRKLERDVRAAKREQAAAKKFGSKAEVARTSRLVKTRQGTLKQFLDGHSEMLRRDYAREKPLITETKEWHKIKRDYATIVTKYGDKAPTLGDFKAGRDAGLGDEELVNRAIRISPKRGEYEWNELNAEEYNKHVPGTPEFKNYQKQRVYPVSELILSPEEAQLILDRYEPTLGEQPRVIFFEADKVIGFRISKTGVRVPTRRGRISFSSTGAHITPQLPGKEKL